MHLLLDDKLEDVIDDDYSTSYYSTRHNWSVDDSCQIDRQRWKWHKVDLILYINAKAYIKKIFSHQICVLCNIFEFCYPWSDTKPR